MKFILALFLAIEKVYSSLNFQFTLDSTSRYKLVQLPDETYLKHLVWRWKNKQTIK